MSSLPSGRSLTSSLNRRTNQSWLPQLCSRDVLLICNMLAMLMVVYTFQSSSSPTTEKNRTMRDATVHKEDEISIIEKRSAAIHNADTRLDNIDLFKEKDFLEIALKTGTDKVLGNKHLAGCLENPPKGACPASGSGAKNKFCRPFGHFYNTVYQTWLGKYSTADAVPFQFMEIGYYQGSGFEAYTKFLPKAEAHSIEISCLPKGPQSEGKWPYGNFAIKRDSDMYDKLRANSRLHCGDANKVSFLNEVWSEQMNRIDAPPLKVVIDDASHESEHMVASVFFWFPRIEPRGVMIVEDIQPSIADRFRTQFLPQMMKDMHFCGNNNFPDEQCFPTLQPLLASIHCEMHICVFERNDEPSVELSMEDSIPPSNALDADNQCMKYT